jgi:hypothetical protein
MSESSRSEIVSEAAGAAKPIRLLSVTDKTGLVEFAQAWPALASS